MPLRPHLASTETLQAAHAVAPAEIITVEEHRVWCDGPEAEGAAALGHPRVYLEMGAAHFVDCPYCDRRFVLAGHAHPEEEAADPGAYDGASGR